jgi:septal ring factor EnvC (AmiA/AmiB activator)
MRLGSTLAFLLPFGAELLINPGALAQTAPAQAPAPQAPTNQAAPGASPVDALKAHDQELDAARARQRDLAENQAKLRIEIDALSADRRKFNEQLIDTASRIRDVEADVAATEARLAPLDQKERLFQKSLDDRRAVIVEILAALQRIGRQPPPALIVRPEDALQAVRTAIALGAVLPEMREQADALAGDLSDLIGVRQQIVDERDRRAENLKQLARVDQHVEAQLLMRERGEVAR